MPDNFIIPILTNSYKKDRSDREMDTLHISNLISFCPREFALGKSSGRNIFKDRYISLSLGVTFDLGRMIEHIVRSRLISEGVILGEWICMECHTSVKGPRPKKCWVCNSKHEFKYKGIEMSVSRHGYNIIGNTDLTLIQSKKQPIFGEVKSMGEKEFDALTEPKIDHTFQLSLYLWLKRMVKAYPFPVRTDKGIVLYVCKAHKLMPMKEFMVNADEAFLKRADNKLKELKAFSKKNVLPQRICSTPYAPMARRPCVALDLCFKEKSIWK